MGMEEQADVVQDSGCTLMLCRKARLCWTGTAWTAYCAPAMAAAMLVVAVTFAGISWSCSGAASW